MQLMLKLVAVVLAYSAVEVGSQFLIGIPMQQQQAPAPAAKPKEMPCRPLAVPNAVYSPPIAGSANISSGGRVMISCAPSYENVGAKWVVCGSDGNWKTAAWSKDAPPSCQVSSSSSVLDIFGPPAYPPPRRKPSLPPFPASHPPPTTAPPSPQPFPIEEPDFLGRPRPPPFGEPSDGASDLSSFVTLRPRVAIPTRPPRWRNIPTQPPRWRPPKSLGEEPLPPVDISGFLITTPPPPMLWQAALKKSQPNVRRRWFLSRKVGGTPPPSVFSAELRQHRDEDLRKLNHSVPPKKNPTAPSNFDRHALTLTDQGPSPASDFRTDPGPSGPPTQLSFGGHSITVYLHPEEDDDFEATGAESDFEVSPTQARVRLRPPELDAWWREEAQTHKWAPKLSAGEALREVWVDSASCPALTIANATFTPASAGTGTSANGASVLVTCAAGFEYIGKNPLVCNKGSFDGAAGASCFNANSSFCRDPNLTPLITGILNQYSSDPLKATEAINRYVLAFRGIRADGLGFIGLNPSAAFQPFETNAYYVPGITGSDATYTSLVLPTAWNLTALPEHLQLQNVFCRVVSNSTTAYVLKVLYKENFGQFSFGNKK